MARAKPAAGEPQTREPLRIVIADDHPLFRQAIGAAVRRLHRASRVVECETLAELHDALAGESAALVLLDLKLPDSEGFAGLLSIKACHPDLAVAIVSATDDAATVANALVCGACAFIPKSASMADLADALGAILAGRSWTPADTRGEALAASPISPSQARILAGLQRGLMNKQIAHELGVSEATVKAHLTVLFRKLGVHSRTQALMAARAVLPAPAQAAIPTARS